MTIDEIVALAGGVMKLAEIAGADHSTVCHWKRVERIPVERAIIISERLGISRHEIRPDIWPNPSAAPSPTPTEPERTEEAAA